MLATMKATRTWPCSDSNVPFRLRAPGTFKALLWWPAVGVHTKLNALFVVQGIRDNWNRQIHKQTHFQVGLNRKGDPLWPLAHDQVQVDDPHFRSGNSESLKDYIHQFDNSTSNISQILNNDEIGSSTLNTGGGAPRWFSPLDCGPSSSFSSDSVNYDDKTFNLKPKSLPLLLYLPGIDGTGLGLVRHHHKLRQIFEVWCLHIPVTDRTSFSELVKLVEGTVRSEYNSSPNRPIYLIGDSVGACLALAVAANNPNIDLMLILANPATSFSRSNLPRLKPLLEWMSSQCFPEGESMSVLKDVVLKRLSQPLIFKDMFEDLDTILSYYPVVGSTSSVTNFLWKIELLKTSSGYVNSRLHAIKAPTLILSSGRDILLSSKEEGERLSNVLSNCDIRSFKDNGHFLFLEDGVDLVYTIKGARFYRRGKQCDFIADFLRPTPSEYRRSAGQYNWLFNLAASPVMLSTLENGEIVKGLDGIPSDGPTILVGNHMLTGLDHVPLVTSLFEQKNIVARGIAHPILFQKPRVAKYFDPAMFDPIRIMGAVPVSASNLSRLLASNSHVLVYPGGVREACHRKGEYYKVFWPEEPEIVRMAAKFGAKVVPFGVVGADDIFELFADYNDLAKIPFLKELIEVDTDVRTRLRSEKSGEVANQPLHVPIIIPKVSGRFYYLFGKPIETAGRRQELRDKQNAQEMYVHIKSEVERSIAYLKERREDDPYRNIFPRLLYQSIHGFTSQVPTFNLSN